MTDRHQPVNQPEEDENKSKSVIVFSYWPLLWPEQSMIGRYMEMSNPAEQMQQLLEYLENSFPSGRMDACLWVKKENDFCAVLATPQAAEIHEHFLAWTENKPEDWFTAYVDTRDDLYAFSLHPDLQKSVGRFKHTHLLVEEEFAKLDDKYTILYQPLSFQTKGSRIFPMIWKQRLKDQETIPVCLIDIGDLNTEDPMSMPDEVFHELGVFKRGDPDEVRSHMDWLFDTTETPKSDLKPWVNPAILEDNDESQPET